MWAGEWGAAHGRPQTLSGRQARHWSRRFSGVGVAIPAARLRQVVAGTIASDAEVIDIRFALTALEIERQQHQAARRRARRAAVQLLILIAVTLVALNGLLCVAYLMLSAVPK